MKKLIFILIITITKLYANYSELSQLTNNITALANIKVQYSAEELTAQTKEFLQKLSLAKDYPGESGSFPPQLVMMVDHINNLYSDKSTQINITAFASGPLNDEYALIRALMQRGYKKILLNAIDPNYESKFDSPEITKFIEHCAKHSIMVKPINATTKDLVMPYVKLGVWQYAGEYVKAVQTNPEIKSDLFITISPAGGGAGPYNPKLPLDKIEIATELSRLSDPYFNLSYYNEIAFLSADFNITLYVPYNHKSFITSDSSTKYPIINNFVNEARSYSSDSPTYQKDLATNLVNKFMSKFTTISFRPNFFIIFLDLMINTAKNPHTAFGFGFFHDIDYAENKGRAILKNVTFKSIEDYYNTIGFDYTYEL